MKLKIIRQGQKIFLIRISFYLRSGTFKAHLILGDDKGNAHKHPWNFKSLLLLGAYKELLDGNLKCHMPLSLIKRNCNQRHKVILYRIFNRRIPCITFGFYSRKIQPWCESKKLCYFCSDAGKCMDKVYWESKI